MAAKILAVVNQKGGSGKTTVSMQLAGALARRQNKVLVVDADPQGTASRWAASAPDEEPFLASVIGLSAASAKVHREVKKFVDDYHYIIIDCPPAADSPVPQSALLIADLALVPIIPSPLDMWATVGIRQVIENVSDLNESLQARLIINQCQPHTTLAQEILVDFPKFLGNNEPLLMFLLKISLKLPPHKPPNTPRSVSSISVMTLDEKPSIQS